MKSPTARAGLIALTLILAVGLSACGKSSSVRRIGNISSPLEAKYCTTWVNFRADSSTPALSVVCLQDQEWIETAAAIETSAKCGTSVQHTGYPELFQSESNELLIGYEKCPGFGSDTELKVRKFDELLGWKLFTPQNVIPNTTTELYSQFGATYFSAFNRVYSFWTATMGTQSYLSYATEGGGWTRLTLPETTLLRHPEHFKSSDDRHFIYYAQPKPRAFEVRSTGLTDLGQVPTPASEYTLYSSFTRWNNQAVIAYSSDTTSDAWNTTVSQIKVALHQGGTTWTILPDPLVDTPGHDGINPHLFVVNNELHIMYADYTSTGLPTSPTAIRFRFRVKKYDGVNWTLVGSESPEVWLSQRFEFTDDASTPTPQVLFNALVLDPADSTKLVKRVMTWSPSGFGYLGNAISLRGNRNAAEHYSRLGKVVVNPDLSSSQTFDLETRE